MNLVVPKTILNPLDQIFSIESCDVNFRLVNETGVVEQRGVVRGKEIIDYPQDSSMKFKIILESVDIRIPERPYGSGYYYETEKIFKYSAFYNAVATMYTTVGMFFMAQSENKEILTYEYDGYDDKGKMLYKQTHSPGIELLSRIRIDLMPENYKTLF